MTGDNEHERENAPDESMPPQESGEAGASNPDPLADIPLLQSFGSEEAQPERPKRKTFGAAWSAAAHEEKGPSLWHRASQKIKSMFTRPKAAEPEISLDEPEPELVSAVPEEAHLIEPISEIPEMAPEPVAEIEASTPVASSDRVSESTEPTLDEPKEDLKFLWSSNEEGGEASAPPSGADSSEPAPVEVVLTNEASHRPKRPSLFQRMLSIEPKDDEVPDTDEHEIAALAPVDEPIVEQPAFEESEPVAAADEFTPIDPAPVTASSATEAISLSEHLPDEPPASLDEALPMDEQPVEAIESDAPVESIPLVPEKKPGFFARLFGRKSKTEEAAPEPEPVPEMEPVADASEQVDVVAEGFEAARTEFAPPEQHDEQSFASVDDALPVDEVIAVDATMDAQPAIDISRFMPPAAESPMEPPPAAPVAASADASAGYFGENTFDFDTPKPEESRSTMEVSPMGDRSTVEATPVAAGADHADELDRKTDEFEMVEMDMSTLQEPAVSPLEGKTAEVPKQSILKRIFSRTKDVTQVEAAVPAPPSANPAFLVQKFRTFYNEVVFYKNQKADLTAGFATAIVTSYDADLSPDQAALSLQQRLQQMLELQLAESSWMGGEIQELYPDAQYAMTVLADEMLANMEWPGQPAWGKHRLELLVFRTAASDVEFFKRVDKLLKNGPQTVGTRDLARTYLLVIASGFKGKYRPFDLPRALAEYRRRLYEFVYGGDALLLYGDDRRIFPEAVSVTIASKGVKRFSLAQQWAAILILILAGYTFISHMAWKKVSADLKDIAGRVEQARAGTPPEPPNGGGADR